MEKISRRGIESQGKKVEIHNWLWFVQAAAGGKASEKMYTKYLNKSE